MIIVLLLEFLAIIVMSGLVALLIAYNLAKKDLFFTLVKEGEIKAVMSGETFWRFIVNVRGYKRETDEHHNLVKVNPGESDGHGLLNRRFGIYWVGLYPFKKIHWYMFDWNKWSKVRKVGTEEEVLDEPRIQARHQEVNSVIFRYPYAIKLTNIEIGGNLAVEISLLVTIQAVNPYKMLFGALPSGIWLAQVTAAIQESLVLFSSNKDFEDMKTLGKKDSPNATELAKLIQEVNDPSTGANQTVGIRNQFGAEVDAVSFLGVEIEGGPEIRAATQARELAHRQAEAVIATAEGEKQATILRGEGKAGAIRVEGDAVALALAAKKAAAGSDEILEAVIQAEALRDFGAGTGARVLGGNAATLLKGD